MIRRIASNLAVLFFLAAPWIVGPLMQNNQWDDARLGDRAQVLVKDFCRANQLKTFDLKKFEDYAVSFISDRQSAEEER